MSRRTTLLVIVLVAAGGLAIGLVLHVVDDEADGPTEVGAAPDPEADCLDGMQVALSARRPPVGAGLHQSGVVGPDGRVTPLLPDELTVSPAWSPDGGWLVLAVPAGDYESAGPASADLWLVRADGSDPIQLTNGDADDEDGSPAWSPDGSTIVFSRTRRGAEWEQDLWLVPADGGDAQRFLDPAREAGRHDPAFAPDGNRVAYASRTEGTTDITRLHVADLSRGSDTVVAELDEGDIVTAVDWHPTDDVLLVSILTGAPYVVDVGTGSATRADDEVDEARWTPDGSAAIAARVTFGPEDPAARSDRQNLVRLGWDGSELGAPEPLVSLEDGWGPPLWFDSLSVVACR